MREQDVEFGGEPDRNRVRAAAGAIFCIDMRVQFSNLCPGEFSGELAHHQALELDADVKSVARILPTRRGHHRDAVAAQLNQAFGGELPERVARDSAADAEPLAERI